MRKLLLVLAAAALAAGCTTPCEELGNRICGCVASGSTRNTCEAQVSEQLKAANPNDGFCSDKLDTCNAPSGQSFCDWIKTADGKVACGYAYPEPATP